MPSAIISTGTTSAVTDPAYETATFKLFHQNTTLAPTGVFCQRHAFQSIFDAYFSDIIGAKPVDLNAATATITISVLTTGSTLVVAENRNPDHSLKMTSPTTSTMKSSTSRCF